MRPVVVAFFTVGALVSTGQVLGSEMQQDQRQWTNRLAKVANDGVNLNGATLFRIGNLRGSAAAIQRDKAAILSIIAEDRALIATARRELATLGPAPAFKDEGRGAEAAILLGEVSDYLALMEATAKAAEAWIRSDGRDVAAFASVSRNGIQLSWGQVLDLHAQRLRVTPDDPHYHALAIRELLSSAGWALEAPEGFILAEPLVDDPVQEIRRHQAASRRIAEHYSGEAEAAVRRKAQRVADVAEEAASAVSGLPHALTASEKDEMSRKLIGIENMMLSVSRAGAAG